MPARAFIVAIENYPKSQNLAGTLPGTQQAGRDFYNWLINTKKLSPQDIFYFTDDASAPGRTGGTTCAEILTGLKKLVDAGYDKTNELYFFFSGHGFFFTDRESSDGVEGRDATDVLISSDYDPNLNTSLTCINFSSVQSELLYSMGIGDHYYFIDACRNNVSSIETGPGAAFKAGRRSLKQRPEIYTLYSTQRGTEAPIASGFGTKLIEALSGLGHAKAWDEQQPNTMLVLFNSVKNYLKMLIPIDVGRLTGGDGKILVLQPPPKYQCTIDINNADPGDAFTVSATNLRGLMVMNNQSFAGRTYQFSQQCDGYFLVVTHPTSVVEPIDADKGKADLYDDCVVHFEKKAGDGAVPVTPPRVKPVMGPLNIMAPADGMVEIRDLTSGKRFSPSAGGFNEALPSAIYRVKVKDRFGAEIRREDVALRPGSDRRVDLKTRPENPLRDQILGFVPHDDFTVDFSESLGPMADNDLALWLSIMGASRIVADADSFSKLRAFDLQRFENYHKDDSPIYVLAGFASERKLSAAVGSADTVRRMLEPVKGFKTLYQYAFKAKPGARLLWLYPAGIASIALATVALPNRATLVVMAEEAPGKVSIRQFILPIHSLQTYLPPSVQTNLAHQNPLETVQFIARAQRDFAAYREIGGKQSPVWTDFLYEKWTDPVLAVIGAYELIRRGDFNRGMLETVVKNLRNYFEYIPDIEAIAKLADLPHEIPSKSPMLLEGYMAVENENFQPPLPREQLDFRGPWTMWRAAEISAGHPGSKLSV